VTDRIRGLALGGWGFAFVLALFSLLRAVENLAHGWMELPFHWWSTLAAVAVVVAAGGFASVLALTRKDKRS
jgi:hypothetical protein